MENLNDQFRNGNCPTELCYNINDAGVDFSKLQYNSYYHSYDFYANKMPKGWGNEPLFIPLIQSIADKAKANNINTLDEINKISNTNNDTNPSKF